MSGVLRRGSLTFECNMQSQNTRRGSIASMNTNGGGDEKAKPRTPEISVISLDFRRHSEDLKNKQQQQQQQNTNQSTPPGNGGDRNANESNHIISDYIGEIGRWQLTWAIVISLFQFAPTFHILAFMYQTIPKDFWCARPDELADMDINLWRNLTQPHGACRLLNIDLNNAPEIQVTDTNNFTACTRFEFSTEEGTGKTLVQEFGLFCTHEKLLSVVEMCFLAGAAVGSVSSGWFSDRYGRKKILFLAAIAQLILGVIEAFSVNLAMYITIRVFLGFVSMTISVVNFVLVVELVFGKWRTIICILNLIPVALSFTLMAGIGYLVRDWRQLQLIISIPWILLILTWYYAPESPCWLLETGHLDKLYPLIEHIARVNKRTLPDNYKKSLEAAVPPVFSQKHLEEAGTTTSTSTSNPDLEPDICPNANPLKVVFSKHYRNTTVLNLFAWFTLITLYFGLSLKMGNLGGDIYWSFGAAGIVEMFSIITSVFIVLKFGVRRSLIGAMLVPSICCLATNLVPGGREDGATGVVVLAVIAKCVIGASNAIIPICTAMQYPTVVRNFGVGMGNLAAGIALILVPYLWLLQYYDNLLPMTIMGVGGLIGTASVFLMSDMEKK